MPFAYIMAFALAVSPAAYAEERVEHYAAVKPMNVQEALTLLAERTALAEQALNKKDLEGVHEQSYTLEAAGDLLQVQAEKQQKALDTLNEAIQEIHALSEKGDAPGVRKALPRLKKATQELKALMR